MRSEKRGGLKGLLHDFSWWTNGMPCTRLRKHDGVAGGKPVSDPRLPRASRRIRLGVDGLISLIPTAARVRQQRRGGGLQFPAANKRFTHLLPVCLVESLLCFGGGGAAPRMLPLSRCPSDFVTSLTSPRDIRHR